MMIASRRTLTHLIILTARVLAGAFGAPSSVSAAPDWASQAESVCSQGVTSAQQAPHVGNIDDESAFHASYASRAQSQAANQLGAIGGAPTGGAQLANNLRTLGQYNMEMGQIYARHVLYSDRLFQLIDQSSALTDAAKKLANQLGAPSCGTLADQG
ncbi:hypothetical protein [Nitrolancea hollandica]|uniref:hypothetical protein n=1 Tax=Nitrolancea hollandica TaxID=1206749 RepID=UPI001267603A|nr:hypothetical protein [Nitrolancea hollandica]